MKVIKYLMRNHFAYDTIFNRDIKFFKRIFKVFIFTNNEYTIVLDIARLYRMYEHKKSQLLQAIYIHWL